MTGMRVLAIVLALVTLPLAWSGFVQFRKRNQVIPERTASKAVQPMVDDSGRIRMRFR
jgi:hypothetical protein